MSEERAPQSIPRQPPGPGSPPIGDLAAAEALVALHDALDRRLLAEMRHGSPHWMALITAFFLVTALVAIFVWDVSEAFDFTWLLILPVPAIAIYLNLIVDERRRRLRFESGEARRRARSVTGLRLPALGMPHASAR